MSVFFIAVVLRASVKDDLINHGNKAPWAGLDNHLLIRRIGDQYKCTSARKRCVHELYVYTCSRMKWHMCSQMTHILVIANNVCTCVKGQKKATASCHTPNRVYTK